MCGFVQVTLEKVFKLDRDTQQPVRDAEAVAKFTRKLQKTVSEQGAQFISYHADTGEWKFKAGLPYNNSSHVTKAYANRDCLQASHRPT